MDYLNTIRARVRDGIVGQPTIQEIFAGEARLSFYRRYLENVWHYAQHSAVVIGLAGTRCVNSHPKLADYLLRHSQEELGHDEWALDDLAALDVPQGKVRASRPVPACAAMIGYEYFVAGYSNPVGLFGWLFVLEAMGDDLGHVASAKLSQGLSMSGGVKFLAGHGEADEEHTKHIIEQIEQNISGPDLQDVHFVADVMGDLYVRIFQEIGEGK